MTLSDIVIAARKRRGWSQRALGAASGISPSQIRDVESGRHAVWPRVQALDALATALRIDLGVLVAACEGPPPAIVRALDEAGLTVAQARLMPVADLAPILGPRTAATVGVRSAPEPGPVEAPA